MALSLQRYTYDGMIARILKERMQTQRNRSQDDLMTSIGVLVAENLLVEILSWLPVKTLMQFKVVCKLSYGIITSSMFISMHLKNYYRNNDDCRGRLIAHYSYTQANELKILELLVDDKAQRLLAVQAMNTPNNDAYICGPCDGIYYSWYWCPVNSRRGLWNPTLNEFKVLPPIIMKPILPSHLTCGGSESYGFGYDPITKDYKVIIIIGYKDATRDDDDKLIDSSVFIYSLRNDSWRYWGDMAKPYYLNQNTCYVFFNNSVYWLGSKEDCRYQYEVIISFNLATDDFELLMPLPDHVNSEPNSAAESIALYCDSIASLRSSRKTNCFMMWTLDDGLWTKKYSANFNGGLLRALGHWKDNKLLFQRKRDILVVYDPQTKEIWDLKHSVSGWCTTVSAYKESLVSVIDRKMWVQH